MQTKKILPKLCENSKPSTPLDTPYTWVVNCELARGYRNVYTLSGKHFMNSFAQQRGKLFPRWKVGTCVGRTQTGRNEEMRRAEMEEDQKQDLQMRA